MIFLTISELAHSNDELIAELGSQEFHLREEAIAKISNAATGDEEKVINGLLKAESHEDPEISRRASTTLERIFFRLEKGYGAPKSGLVVKSKIIMVKMKLGTRPLVEKVEDGSAAKACGLQKGDLIIAVDGTVFEGEDGTSQLTSLLARQNEGAELVIRYTRKGDNGREESETTLTLGKAKSIPRELGDDRHDYSVWKAQQIGRRNNKPSPGPTPE